MRVSNPHRYGQNEVPPAHLGFGELFQTLIGTVKTSSMLPKCRRQASFQTLIGTVKTCGGCAFYRALEAGFQTLIGTVKTKLALAAQLNQELFQTLIGTVKTPVPLRCGPASLYCFKPS